MPVLTQLFVDFKTTGLDSIFASFDQIQGKAANARAALSTVYGSATGFLGGQIRAGLAGTNEGNLLALHFQLISREITAIFLPAIWRVQSALSDTLRWFRSLSGAQQDAIAKWVGVGVAVLGAGVAMNKLAPTVQTLLLAVRGLGLAGVVGGGLFALFSGTEQGRKALSEMGDTAVKFGQSIADAAASIVDVLAPALSSLADFIATPAGKWVALGALILAFTPRIVGAVKAMNAAFTALGGPFGLLITLAGTLAAVLGTAFATSGQQAGKDFVDNLAKEIRAGRKTIVEANAEIDEEVAFQRRRFQVDQPLQELPDLARQLVEQATKRQGVSAEELFFGGKAESEKKRLAELTQGRGQDHRQVTAQGGGFESVAESFRRIQTAINRTDPNKQTADNTGKAVVHLAAIQDVLGEMLDNLANLRFIGR